MLTPEQITALGDQAQKLTSPVTEFLLRDIARRVSEAGQLTSTAAYQVWRSQQFGVSQRELKKRLRKLLKVSHRELRKLLTQAAEAGYDFDIKHLPYVQAVPFEQNTSLQRIVEAAVELALDDFTNLTQTLGMVDPYGNALPLRDVYRSCTDYAFKQVFTGATDYNTAIRRATAELAEKGVLTIDYESGVHTSLEAAVRRNIMGGLGLMQEQISQHNHDELGCDGWEISAHANSAPDHEPIQGKQYSDAEYTALNNSLVRRIGTLNCGHAAFPIIMGVNEPQYTPEQLEQFRADNEKGVTFDGKHYTGYEATQMQRKLERAIRKQKRRVLTAESAGDTERLPAKQTRLELLRQEYSRFSKAAGLRTEDERIHVAGFGHKEAARATAVARPVIEFDKAHLTQDEQELLPNYKSARIPEGKLSGYALNMEHPSGRHKAVAFQKALGYTVDNKQLLISQVHRGLKKYRAIERPTTEHGRPFEVSMMMLGVNGKYAKVKTAWIIDEGSADPRLVTLYVDE